MLLSAVLSCALAFAQQCPTFLPGAQFGTVAHGSLDEISGLAVSRQNAGVLWVHNDSGGSARVVAMNAAGDPLGIYNLTGASAVDYEDIAIGPGPSARTDYLYIADTGNNSLNRSRVTVYRVPEPAAAAEPQGEAIAFAPDGLSYFTVSEGSNQPIYQYNLATPPVAPSALTAVAQSSSEIGLTWIDNSGEVLVTTVIGTPNSLPVASEDGFAVDEDGQLAIASPAVRGNDSDADDDAISAVLASDVSSGTVNLSGDGAFTYQPDPDFHGVDSFIYVADDGRGGSAPATVTITVQPVVGPGCRFSSRSLLQTGADDAKGIARPEGPAQQSRGRQPWDWERGVEWRPEEPKEQSPGRQPWDRECGIEWRPDGP